jgi:pimeloyl-ACP methyl ester carboxylesterase
VGAVSEALHRAGAVAHGGADPIDRVLRRIRGLDRDGQGRLIRELRPGIPLLDDRLAALPPYWRHLVGDRNLLARAARATGLIVLHQGGEATPVGTGFLARPGVVLTARHVAESFIQGVGREGLDFRPGMSASLVLGRGVSVPLFRPLLVHPFWDFAALEPAAIPLDRLPLALSGQPPVPLGGREVVVVGFPLSNDPDADDQGPIKHLQPGQLTGLGEVDSRWSPVEALRCDALTLPGNSGSPVVDIAEGRVLGVHFAREAPAGGASVPAWELARDPHVRALGLFGDADPAPSWLAHWTRVDQPEPQSRDPDATRRPVHLPGDWVERVDDAFLARMLDADPDGTRALLRDAWGDTIAEEIVSELGREPSGEARLGWPPRPDADHPEIVFLHGIIGGHLDDGADRVWFDPVSAVSGELARRLTLAPDGRTALDPSVRIRSGGHIQLIYGLAALRWRHARFRVVPFSFDSRRGLDHAVRQLQAWLRARHKRHPKRRFALVGHSMGGLVALLHAQRHPKTSRKLVRTAVTVGSPIGGALPAFESPTGTYSYLLQMAAVSGREDRAALAAMVRTWPGSSDMLPAPGIYAGAEHLYDPARWPRGTAYTRPMLERARSLKTLLLDSPLHARTHRIGGIGHPTHADLRLDEDGVLEVSPARHEGDGSVPLRSAIPDGLDGWVVRSALKHSFLPLSPEVIGAVPELVLEGRCDLTQVTEADRAREHGPRPRPAALRLDEASPEPEELRAARERLAHVRRRWARGDVGLMDLLAVSRMIDT